MTLNFTTILLMLLLLGVAWFLWEKSRRKTYSVAAGLQTNIRLPYHQVWTLYHNPFSLCSKKIRVCLAEYNVPYKSVPIDLIETGRYQNISQAFLKVNPGATVPVLLHNGSPIYESHEQLKYVAEQVDSEGLLVPRNAEQLAIMEHWVDKTSLIGDDPIAAPRETAGNAVPGLTIPIFASMIARIPTYKIIEGLLFHRIKQRAVFFLVMKVAGLQKFLKPKPVNDIINSAIEAMSGHLDELEEQLRNSQGPWICGTQFTLADVGMMVILDRLREGNWLNVFIAERPVIEDYWLALQERDSFRAGCEDFAHPLVVFATEQIIELKKEGLWPASIPQ